MVESDETLSLIAALEEEAPVSRLDALLKGPNLARMFPAIGIPTSRGIEYLAAVNDPALRKGLDPQEEAVIAYLRELKNSQEHLEALIRRLQAAEPRLVQAAFEKTRRLLPEPFELGDVRLVVLPIGYDFRSDRATVYMDPLAALQYGPEGLRDTLAHELHHVARYRLTGENPTLMRPEEARPPRDAGEAFSAWATWLELEGIADCVSNATQHEIPPLRAGLEVRRGQMDRYSELLVNAMVEFRKPGTNRRTTEAEWSEVFVRLRGLAHPIGGRCAEHILHRQGRTALVDCVGHPGRFLRKYNEVARESRLTQFDQALVRLTARA